MSVGQRVREHIEKYEQRTLEANPSLSRSDTKVLIPKRLTLGPTRSETAGPERGIHLPHREHDPFNAVVSAKPCPHHDHLITEEHCVAQVVTVQTEPQSEVPTVEVVIKESSPPSEEDTPDSPQDVPTAEAPDVEPEPNAPAVPPHADPAPILDVAQLHPDIRREQPLPPFEPLAAAPPTVVAEGHHPDCIETPAESHTCRSRRRSPYLRVNGRGEKVWNRRTGARSTDRCNSDSDTTTPPTAPHHDVMVELERSEVTYRVEVRQVDPGDDESFEIAIQEHHREAEVQQDDCDQLSDHHLEQHHHHDHDTRSQCDVHPPDEARHHCETRQASAPVNDREWRLHYDTPPLKIVKPVGRRHSSDPLIVRYEDGGPLVAERRHGTIRVIFTGGKVPATEISISPENRDVFHAHQPTHEQFEGQSARHHGHEHNDRTEPEVAFDPHHGRYAAGSEPSRQHSHMHVDPPSLCDYHEGCPGVHLSKALDYFHHNDEDDAPHHHHVHSRGRSSPAEPLDVELVSAIGHSHIAGDIHASYDDPDNASSHRHHGIAAHEDRELVNVAEELEAQRQILLSATDDIQSASNQFKRDIEHIQTELSRGLQIFRDIFTDSGDDRSIDGIKHIEELIAHVEHHAKSHWLIDLKSQIDVLSRAADVTQRARAASLGHPQPVRPEALNSRHYHHEVSESEAMVHREQDSGFGQGLLLSLPGKEDQFFPGSMHVIVRPMQQPKHSGRREFSDDLINQIIDAYRYVRVQG